MFLLSCAKTADVRLVLCQDLTMNILNAPENLVWQETKTIMKGYEDLEILLSYTHGTAEQQLIKHEASCFYAYVQDDIGIETFNTPTSAYSTYPSKMIIQNKQLMAKELAPMIEIIMTKQRKQALSQFKDNVEMVREKVQQEFNNINQQNNTNE